MRLTTNIFLLAAAAVLTACSSYDDVESADDDRIVEINVTMEGSTRTSPLATDDAVTAFSKGDMIDVTAYYNDRAVYAYDGEKWHPHGSALYWRGYEMEIQAVYPSGTDFMVEKDQSSIENLQKSDIMSSELKNYSKEHGIDILMQRMTTRLILNFKISEEYDGRVPEIRNVQVRAFGDVQQDPQQQEAEYIIPFRQTDGENIRYTALIAPHDIQGDMPFITFYADDDMKKIQGNFKFSDGIGKSYTYNIMVGKRSVKISSIDIEPWTDETTAVDLGCIIDTRAHKITTTRTGMISSEGIKTAMGSGDVLTVEGPVNRNDMSLINSAATKNLKNLDLSRAHIKGDTQDKDDVLNQYMLAYTTLESLVLPESLKRIDWNAFRDVPLTSLTICTSSENLDLYNAFEGFNSDNCELTINYMLKKKLSWAVENGIPTYRFSGITWKKINLIQKDGSITEYIAGDENTNEGGTQNGGALTSPGPRR